MSLRSIFTRDKLPQKSTMDKILDAQIKQAEINGETAEILERMLGTLLVIEELINPTPIEEAKEDVPNN